MDLILRPRSGLRFNSTGRKPGVPRREISKPLKGAAQKKKLKKKDFIDVMLNVATQISQIKKKQDHLAVVPGLAKVMT